jgi:uncharacterized glyoxalase superfamily protein PhnB
LSKRLEDSPESFMEVLHTLSRREVGARGITEKRLRSDSCSLWEDFEMNATSTTLRQTIFPAFRYLDARAAIAWLEKAFGAKPYVVYDAPDGSIAHAELEIAGNLVMIGSERGEQNPVRSPKEVKAITSSVYVVLPDAAAIDALFERAKVAGAQILSAPLDTDYGSHDCRIYDLEGHLWSFGTYAPGSD